MDMSIASAAAQLRAVRNAKMERNKNYHQADADTVAFDGDHAPIFPKQDAKHDAQFLNQRLGVGNVLRESAQFIPKNRTVWKIGDSTLPAVPNYDTHWKKVDQTSLAIPIDQLKPGGNLMALVQQTMMCYYNTEDRSIVNQVMQRKDEDVFDGICTTGFSIDDIPMNQPLLAPLLPADPTDIFCRLPVHTSIEQNQHASPGCPKFRASFTAYGETIHGFGNNRQEARRDGALKLCYTFQHILDVHDFDAAFWHPLPSKERPKARTKAETELINAVRCKVDEATPVDTELSPRLFQSQVTCQGFKIQAQSFSKKLARKRLNLYLMLLMPKELAKVDISLWLGDGASMAPDAKYGQTDVERGLKRSSDIELERLVKRARNQPVVIFAGSDDELKNKIEKHVTTNYAGCQSFPVNPSAKKTMNFYLTHRCQNRFKFDRIDKKVNDKLVVNLCLPDGTDHLGYGRNLDMAKHSALLEALKYSQTLGQVEPMSAYGICTYGLMHDVCQGIHVAVNPNSDQSIWTCVINAGKPEKGGDVTIESFAASDFTKKGAQRIAAAQFLKQYDGRTAHALKFARQVASEKLKNPMTNHSTILNNVFNRLGMKRPTTDESKMITWKIHGRSFQIKATDDRNQDDEMMLEEIKSEYPYLLLDYEPNPMKHLNGKLRLNQKLKEMDTGMIDWKIEHYDDEIRFFRVSLTLPSKDRFVGDGSNLIRAQRNAAYNCMRTHPVLSVGAESQDTKNYWNDLTLKIGSSGELKSEVISGDPDCPITMYCRVRVTCLEKGDKLCEATATGISKAHADCRAAMKIVEEPTYEGKSCLTVLAERKVSYRFEADESSGSVLKKVVLKYLPGENGDQSYHGEGLSERLARAKAAYSFLCATFGPDRHKQQVREVTSIKQIKPYNRNGEDDPELPPLSRERGNQLPENPPNLNEQWRTQREKILNIAEKAAIKKSEAKAEAQDKDDVVLLEDMPEE